MLPEKKEVGVREPGHSKRNFLLVSQVLLTVAHVTSLPNKVLTKFFVIMVKFDVR